MADAWEPVPSATQLIAVPFAAAVAGFLKFHNAAKLRVVLHRVMSSEGQGYIQQIGPYVGDAAFDLSKSGRVLAFTEGIIGHALLHAQAVRTRRYDTKDELLGALQSDMKATGDERSVDDVALSYLAVPMLGANDRVVSILYADSGTFNFFANDELLRAVIGMAVGFCKALDSLADTPLDKIRVFPLDDGRPVLEKPSVYPTLQERLDIPPPRFSRITSLNFESKA